MTTERCIALALLCGGRDKLTRSEILQYANTLGVTTRSVYRYLEKIAKAKFLIKSINTQTL